MNSPLSPNTTDMLIRAFWTFVEAFLSTLLVGGLGVVDVNVLEAALIGGVGSALTVILVYSRQQLGRTTAPASAASLPAYDD